VERREDEGDAGRYATGYHAPVLWHTVVRDLITNRSGVYVDGTLGGGGHTAALLDALADDALVIGIDRDREAHEVVRSRLGAELKKGRLRLAAATFAEWPDVLDDLGIEKADGLLLDIGVSSHQLDEASRGFSYAAAGPLDMRMNPAAPVSAADVVNEWAEADLRQVLYDYGEESRGRAIAAAIVRSRPIEDTAQLANVVRSAVPTRDEVKSLSRVFQALRIVVNDELGQLERALKVATDRIAIGGRVAVISYHSLEDRRAKRFFRSGNFEGEVERDLYGNRLVGWRELYRKPVVADPAEVQQNPRARSARLRIGERVKEVSAMQ
jgi:16S rRNA (cytosine1402-N4)-methyltransferase